MSTESNTAGLGCKHEQLFTDLRNMNSLFNKYISYILCIRIPLEAVSIKGRDNSNVNLYFGNNAIVCSLKSAKANFNQLDRRWIKDWGCIIEMPEHPSYHIQFKIRLLRIIEFILNTLIIRGNSL